ncbi:MAG: deoxyribonuclease V [Candidatus Lernaella stagnicola]|nr:deoxyribonuclease V [Candidatus Lernaella stagnicola]
MRPVFEHPWNLTPTEAVNLQRRLADRVVTTGEPAAIETVCGVDVSYDKTDDNFFAAVVVMNPRDFAVIETRTAMARSPFPYVPGLLSFRELPVVIEALAKLQTTPDLLACDGHGLAHPRRFGLACHLGVLFDCATIGLAKSRLVGTHEEPGLEKGDWTWLVHKDERIGQVVRTRRAVSPLFVSPGHRLGFGEARQWALRLCPTWRLPETTRAAHRAVNEFRRGYREQADDVG